MLMVASEPHRGRERRVPGERTVRVKVSLAESELQRLRAVAQLNLTTVSEFLRDAANAAAEESGAEAPFVERRAGHDRRQLQVPAVEERRRKDRRG